MNIATLSNASNNAAAGLLLLLLLAGSSVPAYADGPVWQRAEAISAASHPQRMTELRKLFDLARTGQNDELSAAFLALESESDWPDPAKDHLLFTFTVGLGDLRPNSVSKDILEYLSHYQAKTLVPHEDHANAAVPLFNIRAAAVGVAHGWGRLLAQDRALELLNQDLGQPTIEAWLSAYINASSWERAGFVDALDVATPEQLEQLKLSAFQRVGMADYGAIAGRTAILQGDVEAIALLLVDGHGTVIAAALDAARRHFSTSDQAWLLRLAVSEAPAPHAAIAIAKLSPQLRVDPDTQLLLLAQLGHVQLGAAAALALSADHAEATRTALAAVAQGDNHLAATRANMALELSALNIASIPPASLSEAGSN